MGERKTLFAQPEPFLRTLFASFERVGLRYVVLRNFESYPHAIDKPDVGLLVHDQDVGLLQRTAREVASEIGHAYRCRKDVANVVSIYLTQVFEREDGWEISQIKLHVRVFEPFAFTPWMRRLKGHDYRVLFEEIETRRVDQDGCAFQVPAPEDAFPLLLKQWRRKGDARHRAALEQALESANGLGAWIHAATGLGPDDWRSLLDAPESPGFDRALGQVAESRWGRRTPLRFLKRQARSVGQVVKRAVERARRPAPILYFSGPDGCGKTTTVRVVRRFLEDNGIEYRYFYTLHKVLRHLGLRAAWLTSMAAGEDRIPFKDFKGIGGGHEERDTGTLSWKAAKLAGLLVSINDVYIGLTLAWILRHVGIAVLVETSPHDLFVKYHMPEFPLLERIVLPLIPSPDVGFLMTADPQAIVDRKPELTVEEIEHYYRRIATVHARARETKYLAIRTDVAPSKTAVSVLKALLETLQATSHD